MQPLTLPDGILLTQCSPHLHFTDICILTCTCTEARKQSQEWKKKYLEAEGIQVSLGKTEVVWKSYFCTPINRDPELSTRVLLRRIQTYVSNELAVCFGSDPVKAEQWKPDKKKFLLKALTDSGLTSTNKGRHCIQEFMLKTYNQNFPTAVTNVQQISAAEFEATFNPLTDPYIAVSLIMHTAIFNMMSFVLNCFVVDEEKGVVMVF